MRACRSRVTHPSAGRRQLVLLPVALPLDLHVLSLPLAFILSQDQTLLCIVLKFLASWHPFHSCVSGGHPCHARHGIDALEFLVFRYLLYCFSSLVNDLFMSIREPLSPSLGPPFPERDCKGTPFFFPSKLFRDFFASFFLPAPAPKSSNTCKPPNSAKKFF